MTGCYHPSLRRSIAKAIVGSVLLCAAWTYSALAAEPLADSAAARAYAAAAALQNRQLYELAADEWGRFLEKHPQDARADLAHYYRGVCLFQTKQYEPAAGEFRAVVVGHPKSQQLEAAYYQLGLALYRHGQANHAEAYVQAAEALALLAQKFPQSKRLPAATFYRGEALYGGGDKPGAIAEYERFLKSYPQHELAPEALYALTVSQDEVGQGALAAQSARRFLETYPQHRLAAEVRLRLAQIWIADGKAVDAEALLAKAAESDSPLADLALLKQAESVESRGDWLKAAALYGSLTGRFTKSRYRGVAQLGAGRSLYRGGEAAKARKHLAPLLDDPPQAETADAAHWMAQILLQAKQPAEAVLLIDRVLPGAGHSLATGQLAIDRGDALAAVAERRQEAVAQYLQMARDYPEHPLAPRALYLAAFTAHQMGDFARAVELAADVTGRFPQDSYAADAGFVAAESLLQLGRNAEARARLAALVRDNPKNASAPRWALREAWAAYLDKQPREAIELVKSWNDRWVDAAQRAEALYLAGIAHIELKETAEGIQSLRESWDTNRDWRQADEALMALAEAEQKSGELAVARKTLETLIERFAESALLDRAYLKLGDVTLAVGDNAAARAAYERIVRQWPDGPQTPLARLGLGWTLLKLGDHSQCVTTVTLLFEPAADAALARRARYVRAVANYELKQYPAAIGDLQSVLAAMPEGGERSDARYMLGLCQSAQGDATGASATFGALLADDPNYGAADRATYELAWARRSAGQVAESQQAFATLAERFPQSPLAGEARFQQAEIDYEAQRYAEATGAYAKALELAGEGELGEKSAHKAGWANFRLGKFDEAREAFERQRATWPQGALAADASFMLGEIAFQQERWDEALAALVAAEGMSDPEFRAAALLHAAQAAAQLKDFARSGELAARCASEFPKSARLPDAIYAQGWAAQNQDQSDAALALYQQVIDATDAEIAAQARFMMGEIQFARGQHAEAVRDFFKVAYGYRHAKWQAAAHYEAGRCFEVLQKQDQARKSYQEVVDKFPQSEQAAAARERLSALAAG